MNFNGGNMSIKRIWITWENQRRNKGISSAAECELYEILYSNTGIIRYIKSLCKTACILTKNRPDVVVAQNPSIILAAYIVLLKYIFRYTSIIDAHNAGLFPYENKIRLLTIISKAIQKLSDLTIVTNKELAKVVSTNKGRAFVLPDRLPDPPEVISQYQLSGKHNLAFICSFSSDEPYNEVIAAARNIPNDIHIYITGKYPGKINVDELPSNVKMLGYIPDNDYWSLLSSVDGIIVLTTRENCLVCGAYEAVALKKPMILSNTMAIKNYFSLGTVYTNPGSKDIQSAILCFLDSKGRLAEEVEILEKKLRKTWDANLADFSKVVMAMQ